MKAFILVSVAMLILMGSANRTFADRPHPNPPAVPVPTPHDPPHPNPPAVPVPGPSHPHPYPHPHPDPFPDHDPYYPPGSGGGSGGDSDAVSAMSSVTVLLLLTTGMPIMAEKAAIQHAHVGALNVLNGEEVTDLFINGRLAVEKLRQEVFASDIDAAIAIIRINEALDHAEK